MKKLLSMLIAIALMLSLSVTAFAVEDSGNLSITRGDETYYYDDMVAAFTDAEDGDVIKVEQNYTEKAGLIGNWEDNTLQSFTFDLNGKEIHFPEDEPCFEDHGMVDINCTSITLIDTVGGGIIHAIVVPYGDTVVKGGTYRGFWTDNSVSTTIEGGTFLGLPQEIVDGVQVWGEAEKTAIGTKGLLVTSWGDTFETEDAARAALDALIADGYAADKPFDIHSYESYNGETRYSAGFAANTKIVKVEDHSTTVSYNVDPAYTVTIPTDVTIDGNATTISAEDVVVEKGKYVSVTLAAENNFTVTTAEGATLTYTVTANGENVAAGDEILAVNPTDGKTGSATVTFAIDESAIQYAGTYTGSATFTIAVKDVPTINFTLDTSWIEEHVPGLTTNLQAKAGMTWGEWMESEYNVDGYVPHTMRYGAVVVSVPNSDWAITDGGYPNYVEYTDEIIANHTYNFSITGG